MTNRITEIAARNAARTPGDYRVYQDEYKDWQIVGFPITGEGYTKANCDFVADSLTMPADIEYLLKRVDVLKAALRPFVDVETKAIAMECDACPVSVAFKAAHDALEGK